MRSRMAYRYYCSYEGTGCCSRSSFLNMVYVNAGKRKGPQSRRQGDGDEGRRQTKYFSFIPGCVWSMKYVQWKIDQREMTWSLSISLLRRTNRNTAIASWDGPKDPEFVNSVVNLVLLYQFCGISSRRRGSIGPSPEQE